MRYLSTFTNNLVGTSKLIEIFLDDAYISITRVTSWSVGRRLHRTSLGKKVPRAICALSSVSFTLLSISKDENFIISRCFRRWGFYSFVSRKSVKLIQVLRGVRISWLTLAEYIVVRRSFVSRSRNYCTTVMSCKKISIDSIALKWICLMRIK